MFSKASVSDWDFCFLELSTLSSTTSSYARDVFCSNSEKS